MISGIAGQTKPKPGVMINPAHPLSKGLVGCWLFNEGAGSRANDISGHGNHGTLVSMEPNVQGSGWGESKFGGGVGFDGGWVDCGNDKSLDILNAYTVHAIVKMNTVAGGFRTIASKGEYNYYELFNSADYVRIEMKTSGGTTRAETPVGGISLHKWHHISYTYNSTAHRIYIDGINQTLTYGTGPFYGTLTPTTNDYMIGARNGAIRFNGIIDSIRVYNRDLSAWEIEQLYHDPFCNLLTPRRWYVPAAGPSGAIMNQFQKCNIGADLYNGALAI